MKKENYDLKGFIDKILITLNDWRKRCLDML